MVAVVVADEDSDVVADDDAVVVAVVDADDDCVDVWVVLGEVAWQKWILCRSPETKSLCTLFKCATFVSHSDRLANPPLGVAA